MKDVDVENLIKAMNSNACKMVSATLMAALVGSDLPQEESNKKMESLLPKMAAYSTSLSGHPKTVFSVNFLVWSFPDNIRSGFFKNEDLTWAGLVGVIQAGMNEWLEISKNKNIPLSEIAPLFVALKELLLNLFEGEDSQRPVVTKLVAIQDHYIQYFNKGDGVDK